MNAGEGKRFAFTLLNYLVDSELTSKVNANAKKTFFKESYFVVAAVGYQAC